MLDPPPERVRVLPGPCPGCNGGADRVVPKPSPPPDVRLRMSQRSPPDQASGVAGGQLVPVMLQDAVIQ